MANTTKTAPVASRRAVAAAVATFCRKDGTSKSLTVEIPVNGETLVRKAKVTELDGYMAGGMFHGKMVLVPSLHAHDAAKLGEKLREDGTVHLYC